MRARYGEGRCSRSVIIGTGSLGSGCPRATWTSRRLPDPFASWSLVFFRAPLLRQIFYICEWSESLIRLAAMIRIAYDVLPSVLHQCKLGFPTTDTEEKFCVRDCTSCSTFFSAFCKNCSSSLSRSLLARCTIFCDFTCEYSPPQARELRRIKVVCGRKLAGSMLSWRGLQRCACSGYGMWRGLLRCGR